MINLRDYQRAAIDATWQCMRDRPGENPCIVIPGGGGKTFVIATLCREAVENWQGRVIVVSHVRELLSQTKNALEKIYSDGSVGVYSAGMNTRCTDNDVIIGGIQSIYKRAGEFGRRHILIVDEAHTISDRDQGMYRKFISDMSTLNPNLRIIGTTATPFRTATGMICEPENILNYISYSVPISHLISEGYLTPLRNTGGVISVDTSEVKIVRGDFAQNEIEDLFDVDNISLPACKQIVATAANRKATLVFTSGVRHGTHICERLNSMGLKSEFICGETIPLERDSIISRFRSGQLPCVVNVNVLSIGTDIPRIDLIAVLRSTTSPGFFYQAVARGTRLCEGKEFCTVIDYGGNIERHGAIDAPDYGVAAIAAWKASAETKEEKRQARLKTCPSCGEQVAIQTKMCPCGFEFPPSMMPVDPDAANPILQSAAAAGVPPAEWKDIFETEYCEHKKKNWEEGDPVTLRVEYHWSEGIRDWPVREWVCFEHEGFAREKAKAWWKRRTNAPFPANVQDALYLIISKKVLAKTKAICVGKDPKNPKWDRIEDYEIGPLPEVQQWGADPNRGCLVREPEESVNDYLNVLDDEIPF